MVSILKKIFGSRNDRILKQYRKLVAQINALEPAVQALSDTDLAAKTAEFRQRIEQGTSLDDLLPEAFAVVREAGKRVFGMRHFDVQLLGGIALHYGKIAEMRTGEGKTLMATLPVYLNALSGKGVHVVTVNDYLARRDATQMGRLYNFLGLTVGVVVPQQENEEKRAAYQADITYGTNNEYGFDYLRDNMEYRAEDRRQRGLSYAIIDEVDSILIDEARTPLIISGQAEDNTELYLRMNIMPPLLVRMASEPKPHEPEPEGDFWVDEKSQQVHLSEAGQIRAEELLKQNGLLPESESLYDPRHISLVHHLMVALRAHMLFFRDQQYVVQNGEIVIVDEFTGRLMTGRRWSDGLHQAVEAKEGVKIQNENQTLASITFQNYFRMYQKLSGMTGTAETEATEFVKIYNMNTWVIPTHKTCIREDKQDVVYKSEDVKWTAIVKEIKRRHEKGQPLLVGTASIEKSEKLSLLLKKEGIVHEVLNAKNHGREAEIIQFAGHLNKVTIATNMAGRGTDIALGPGVVEVGGLHVLGTERHESRRIDNQLRGRSGRQGDPGSSQYFLSLDDNLMRIFGGANVKQLMSRFNIDEGEAITHSLVTRSIRGAQRRVEGQSFDARKYLLDYDNVMNEQRKVIYGLRRRILNGEDIRNDILNRIEDAIDIKASEYIFADRYPEEWNLEGLHIELERSFNLDYRLTPEEAMNMKAEAVLDQIIEKSHQKYEKLMEIIPADDFKQIERRILLLTIDQHWKEHLYGMDQLKEAIRFQGYAQKDPLMVYKAEGFKMFESCLESIATMTAIRIMNIRIKLADGSSVSPELIVPKPQAPQQTIENSNQIKDTPSPISQSRSNSSVPASSLPGTKPAPKKVVPVKNEGPKLGRNDLCWCGSGLKFKKCHGKDAE